MSEASPAPQLSIVIPAWNEQRRLPGTLRSLAEFAAAGDPTVELVVVDDGSTDATPNAIEQFDRFLKRLPPAVERPFLVVLHNAVNRGKGHAVRRGMLAATGPLRLMCDADLSTPIEEWPRLAAQISNGCDIAIGSRDLPESRLDPPQPFLRHAPALLFRALRRRLLLKQIRDTQCGFKLFTAAAAQRVFELATVDGWLFDCEVLALAERLGLRTAEVGVTWRNDRDSRVSPLREALRTLPELRRIRRRVRELRVSNSE